MSAILGTSVAASGCAGTLRLQGHAHVAEPSLVYVSPGVYVVEDYHEPVFYTDGYYWRSYNGVWYRSHVHHGNWAYVSHAPHRVRRIKQRHRYVRYRAPARAKRRAAPRARDHRDHRRAQPRSRDRNNGVRVRDHRDRNNGVRVRDRRSPKRSRPAVRDHRDKKARPNKRWKKPSSKDHKKKNDKKKNDKKKRKKHD